MIKKTFIASLTIASLQSYADHQFITCDNYKDSIVQETEVDYLNGVSELDCSENDMDNLAYSSLLKSVEKFPEFKHRDINQLAVDKHFISFTDQKFITDYFLKNGTYIKHLSILREEGVDVDEYLVNGEFSSGTYMNRSSLEQTLSGVDECVLEQKERFIINHSNVNLSDRTNVVKAWFLSSCGEQKARLFVQDTQHKDINQLNSYSFNKIDHSFTFFNGSEIYKEQKFSEIRDISYDGEAVLMQFVLDNSDSGIDGSLHVVSQLAAVIYRHNKLYQLPLQKFINRTDYSHSRLSIDGSKVAIASNTHVKLFEYQNEIEGYVLVGHHQIDDSRHFSASSIQLSPDGLSVYLTIDSEPHEVQFQKSK